jgi:hypothetical protein
MKISGNAYSVLLGIFSFSSLPLKDKNKQKHLPKSLPQQTTKETFGMVWHALPLCKCWVYH